MAAATVRDVMTTEFPRAAPSDSVERVATLMHDEAASHVPVVEDDRVVGIGGAGRSRQAPRGHDMNLVCHCG